VSVFLRWGILGILGVAGLLYAYNASKRISAARAPAPTALVPVAAEHREQPAPAARSMSAACEAELQIARRAMDMRRQSAPLDRLLRSQEIAWQEPAERRERLGKVATRWYDYQDPISDEALRSAVLSDCEQSAQAP